MLLEQSTFYWEEFEQFISFEGSYGCELICGFLECILLHESLCLFISICFLQPPDRFIRLRTEKYCACNSLSPKTGKCCANFRDLILESLYCVISKLKSC